METRPNIKLTLLPIDRRLEALSKLLLVALWCLTFYSFIKLPPTIPTHFNVLGKPDKYGNKLSILILPVFATIVYVSLTILNKYPHIFNYPTAITEENAEKQYTIATRMLRFLKLAVLVIFSFITLATFLSTLGISNGLGVWFLPSTSGIILITIIVSIGQLLKKNTVK